MEEFADQPQSVSISPYGRYDHDFSYSRRSVGSLHSGKIRYTQIYKTDNTHHIGDGDAQPMHDSHIDDSVTISLDNDVYSKKSHVTESDRRASQDSAMLRNSSRTSHVSAHSVALHEGEGEGREPSVDLVTTVTDHPHGVDINLDEAGSISSSIYEEEDILIAEGINNFHILSTENVTL